MPRPLVIIGANGFALQVAQWILDINNLDRQWEIAGFISINNDIHPKAFNVLGDIKTYNFKHKELVACGLLMPAEKKYVIDYLQTKKVEFISVIHPTTCIAKSAHIGKGVVIFPNATISTDTKVGNFVSVLYSGLGHDAVAEDYATIGSGCDITGGVHIGKGVFLGTGSIIVPYKKIGEGAIVKPGSIVIKNVKPYTTVSGNPARICKSSF